MRFVAIASVVSSSLLACVLALTSWAPVSLALNCQETFQLTNVYFAMHTSARAFDAEISRRTLDMFLKSWDPGKLYFLQADVDRFQNEYGAVIGDMLKRSNCGVIDDVVNVYSKRFAERQRVVARLIDLKHDFTVDEYLDLDRKNMTYAKTTEELDERWRKYVKFQVKTLKTTLQDMNKARSKLKKRYDLLAKRHQEMKSDDAYSRLLNSFSLALDPHSEYMSADMLEDFRIQTSLSLEGIGAVLRSEDGFTVIQSMVPGGAANKTGKLKNGDKIIAVAQGADEPVDVIDMDLRDVVKMIRGKRATEVRLTVVREAGGDTTQMIVPVIREQVQLTDRAAKSRVFDVRLDDKAGPITLKVGVVYLPSFYMDFEKRQSNEENYRSSSSDMKKEIKALREKNVDALIVDLRGNGGGALDESVTVAGLFIDKGPVVQSKSPKSTRVYADEDAGTFFDGPLAVLINRHSASASEIFAGAIQDYGRGLIIGDTHTFGKGTVQNVTDITDKLGAVKVTISKFYRPSGASTQLRGVESDVVIPDIMDEYEIGEKFLDYALPWDKIKKTRFSQSDRVARYVAKLRGASKKRVATDASFKEVLEGIKKYKDGEAERDRLSLKDGKGDEKAAKEAEEDLELDDSQDIPLDKDPQLQEGLRIVGDYVQLQSGRALTKVNLPLMAQLAADKKSKAKEEASQAGRQWRAPMKLEETVPPGEHPGAAKKPSDGEYKKTN